MRRRRPPALGRRAVRLQPVLVLRRPRQAVGRPLRRRGWAAVTLVSYRCLPEGGRSHPRPGSFTQDAVAGLTASGPLAAVDAYGRPNGRPRWLAGEYLALLEHQG